MSNYDIAEASTHDGSPVECYKFIGTFRTYLYTSADVPVTLNGETYEPIPTSRQSIRAGTQADDNLALEIALPYNVDVVQDYAYAESPPSLVLELYRVHRGTSYATDWVLLWKGRVTSFNVDGRVAKLRIPSIFSSALQGNVPNAFYQNPCNHVLYDGRCGLSRSLFTQLTTVIVAGQTAFEVADDGFPDDYLQAGEAVITRSGERRMILSNVVNVIQITYPFVDLRLGDEVELVAGCDHSWTTCKTKFNNGARYGGHPHLPADNPFQGDLG